MAVLFAFEEQGRFGEADARQYVCSPLPLLCCLQNLIVLFNSSVRFAPPLVISEEDMKESVKIIGECLLDFDQVSCPFLSFLQVLIFF